MEIATNEICQHIYTFRGHQVILDTELAKRYQVEVGALKRAVRRNMKRFPSEFMFELTKDEHQNLKCQSGISSYPSVFEIVINAALRAETDTLGSGKDFRSHGGNRHLPFAFTESGVAMLSSVLHSERAIQVNIGIMKAFIQLRKQAVSAQSDLAFRIESLEKKISHLESKSNPAINDNNQVLLIQSTVANHWGLRVEDLQSATRKKSVSLARQVAIYLIRKQMQLSFSEIGSHFGERDHTTILYAHQKILAGSGSNRMLHGTLILLESRLMGTQPAHLRSLLA